MPSLTNLTLSDFLAGVASTEPAPGAGATGAMTLAMGIACARKAIRITALHHPDERVFAETDERLAQISLAAIEGADRDAAGFTALIHALRLPHSTPEETERRSHEIHTSSAELVTVAETLIALGEEVREALLRLAPRLDPVMINDVNAALTLIESNRKIQSDNARENRAHLG